MPLPRLPSILYLIQQMIFGEISGNFLGQCYAFRITCGKESHMRQGVLTRCNKVPRFDGHSCYHPPPPRCAIQIRRSWWSGLWADEERANEEGDEDQVLRRRKMCWEVSTVRSMRPIRRQSHVWPSSFRFRRTQFLFLCLDTNSP